MGKILDITPRLRSQNSLENKENEVRTEVLDITEARQEILSRDRRDVKRTILTEFVGAFVVLPERGLLKAALYDISENGMAFDLELADGGFAPGDEVAMRVYLNHSTYFPFTIVVSNSRAIEDEGIVRHGAGFVKGTMNDVALHHFVKFIENVSASLKTDTGDVLVSHIS
ncbi:PilZ domain-containing protein [Bdellovibrio bacteriovorus]|uniref:PilZ domain-containing protein n=1 Tax=Bdellovibrio bacteriovorus TaxID=959 RepID=UPI0021D21D65|nr:PilZ domain-containing protein [Bdellovibrio bacteriovorus]UXR64737.1 PilZ domain-containing protein [Bdellovibrio bacteriovorus]